jgi:hypothetical protein
VTLIDLEVLVDLDYPFLAVLVILGFLAVLASPVNLGCQSRLAHLEHLDYLEHLAVLVILDFLVQNIRQQWQ